MHPSELLATAFVQNSQPTNRVLHITRAGPPIAWLEAQSPSLWPAISDGQTEIPNADPAAAPSGDASAKNQRYRCVRPIGGPLV